MRPSIGGSIGIFALAVCVFNSFAICKPAAAPGWIPYQSWPPYQSWSVIATLPAVGTLPVQTVTASAQIVTYIEATRTTTTTVTFSETGTYSEGCYTTVISKPGIYTIESPQQVDYYCPYSVYELFTLCPLCPKTVVAKECQFGTCNLLELEIIPIDPIGSSTYLIDSSLGWGCTPSVAGGNGFSPTSYSYFTGGGAAATTTIDGVVIIEQPYVTETVSLPAGASGYTSFISGIEIIGIVTTYVAITSYFTEGGTGYSTTVGNSVIVELPYSTTTLVLPATASAFTSTEANGTIVVGSPTNYVTGPTHSPGNGTTMTIGGTIVNEPYVTVTSYLASGTGYISTLGGGTVVIGQPIITTSTYLANATTGFTQTLSGTEIDGVPYVTSTICSGVTSPYSSTTDGTIFVGSVPPTITITATIPANSPGYSSIRHADSCSATGTIVIFTPAALYVTSTSYLDHGEPGYTTTEGATIVVGAPVPTITTTLPLSAYQSAYTSTVDASGSVPGTVVFGIPIPYVTTTSFLDDGEPGFTSTIGNAVIVGISVPTITETATLSPGLPGYTSIIPALGSVDGTVVVGEPLPYITETSYLDNGGAGYTSTLDGSIIIGLPVTIYTIQTTLSAGAQAFTSTITASGSVPGTVIIATPAPYVSATSYFSGGGSAYTTTTQGSVIVYDPYITVTDYFNTATGGVATTIAGGGTLTVYVPYAVVTSYFASAGSAYSTTISGTIYYVTAYITSTSYIYSGSHGTTITDGGSLVIVSVLPTVTITDFIVATGAFSGSAGGPAYTSTIAASGSEAGTVLVGYIQTILTVYSTIGSTLGTQTIAASETAAGTVIVSVPTACNNAGLQMGVYQMPSNSQNDDDDATYSSFNATMYKSLTPTTDTSTSPYFNCPSTGLCTITNATTPLSVNTTFLVIDYHGYFIPSLTGSYTFSSKYVDDILLLWFGRFAYSGWTRSNAVLDATYGDYPGDNEVHSYTVPLLAGSYNPLRIMYGNADGPGIFELDLTGPSGQPIPFTGANLVQFSCDGVLAPAFPPYGNET